MASNTTNQRMIAKPTTLVGGAAIACLGLTIVLFTLALLTNAPSGTDGKVTTGEILGLLVGVVAVAFGLLVCVSGLTWTPGPANFQRAAVGLAALLGVSGLVGIVLASLNDSPSMGKAIVSGLCLLGAGGSAWMAQAQWTNAATRRTAGFYAVACAGLYIVARLVAQGDGSGLDLGGGNDAASTLLLLGIVAAAAAAFLATQSGIRNASNLAGYLVAAAATLTGIAFIVQGSQGLDGASHIGDAFDLSAWVGLATLTTFLGNLGLLLAGAGAIGASGLYVAARLPQQTAQPPTA